MAKYRSFVPLGVATIIALVVSVLLYGYLHKRGNANDTVLDIQPVTVAALDLSWGTKLTEEMMKQVDFLKGSLPEGSFSDPSSIAGRVLIYPVKKNEPIFESRLAPQNVKTSGVVAVIRPRKRAVAVKVDKVIGVSGYVHPGSRVDVLITLGTGRTYNPVTKIILENLLVLAVGAETKEKKGSEEKASPADVITLEVTPEEAEKLAMAAVEGRIQLALRNFNDTESVVTPGVTLSGLLGPSSGDGPLKETKKFPKPDSEIKRPVPRTPSPPAGKEPLEEHKPLTVTDASPARGEAPTPGGVEEAKPAKAAADEKRPSVFVVEVIKGSKVDEVKFEESE